MKIKEFKLFWHCDIYEQVITWWSKIKVSIIFEELDPNIVLVLDYSNYKKWWIDNIKISDIKNNKYQKKITVDFLWEKWIFSGKNNDKTKIYLYDDKNNVYSSNSIWIYKHTDNFINFSSAFYNTDHHLWVYNMYESDKKDKISILSEKEIYKNDIIFIDRWKENIDIFIDLDAYDIGEIVKKFTNNIKNRKKSIFYLDIFKNNINLRLIKSKVEFIFYKFWKYRDFINYYNIPFCFLPDFGTHLSYNILYNYHFKPILNKFNNKECGSCKYADICSWVFLNISNKI